MTDTGRTAPPENAASTRNSIKLWTAIITLLGVVLGFGYTALQLLNQSKDLKRIEQNFRNLDELRYALMMPLEGVWDYRLNIQNTLVKQIHHGTCGAKLFFFGTATMTASAIRFLLAPESMKAAIL